MRQSKNSARPRKRPFIKPCVNCRKCAANRHHRWSFPTRPAGRCRIPAICSAADGRGGSLRTPAHPSAQYAVSISTANVCRRCRAAVPRAIVAAEQCRVGDGRLQLQPFRLEQLNFSGHRLEFALFIVGESPRLGASERGRRRRRSFWLRGLRRRNLRWRGPRALRWRGVWPRGRPGSGWRRNGLGGLALTQPIAVAAHIFVHLAAAFEHQRARDHIVEKRPVVADEEQGPLHSSQPSLPADPEYPRPDRWSVRP